MGMLDYIRHSTKRRLLRGERVNWIENSKRAGYIRQVVLSAPPWITRSAFAALEEQRTWLSEMWGSVWVLDHIVPLNRPRVCGLTVPWNLEPVPYRANLSKGNAWAPEQLELDSIGFGRDLSAISTRRRTSRLAGSVVSAITAGTQTSMFASEANTAS